MQSTKPFAYITEEGGDYLVWDDPPEAFAIFYKTGLVLDRVAGPYKDKKWTDRARKIIREVRAHEHAIH